MLVSSSIDKFEIAASAKCMIRADHVESVQLEGFRDPLKKENEYEPSA